MMITFFGNSLNIHQVHFSDEMYKMLGDNYTFVVCTPTYKANLKGGKNFHDRPYCFAACENEENKILARSLALNSDVAIFGANSLEYEVLRMRQAPHGLSFEVSERWLKSGWKNFFSPRLLRWLWHYHYGEWNKKNLYKLCASAFAAGDHYKMQSFKGKCYKWGYFTKVDQFDTGESLDNSPSIMWCARFLDWKHPELVIKLAKELRSNGYHVPIDMYGTGEKSDDIQKLCNQLQVADMVSFKGSVPNDEIFNEMHRHNIFLFTSDKREGWGAVLNEAMSCGCAVVASNEIGSVPYLINDSVNGFCFKSKDVNSLYEKVKYLIDHQKIRRQMGIQAYQTMQKEWSPKVAACNFLQLVDDLNNGRDTSIKKGPCSKALPIK